MSFIDKISNDWITKIRKAGAGTLVIIILLLFLDYYKAIQLSAIPIPNLSMYLWGYLIINAGGTSILHYFFSKEHKKGITTKRARINTRGK